MTPRVNCCCGFFSRFLCGQRRRCSGGGSELGGGGEHKGIFFLCLACVTIDERAPGGYGWRPLLERAAGSE